jgi:hypothetical protein
MNPLLYSVLHVLSGFLLVALTFQAFAAPRPETRKRVLALSGIAALVMLVAGFGLVAKLNLGFPGWVIVKLLCWLVLAGLAGTAYRRPGSTGALAWLATGLVAIALYMVYLRPF